jgi:hypothetical protein
VETARTNLTLGFEVVSACWKRRGGVVTGTDEAREVSADLDRMIIELSIRGTSMP